MVCCFISLATYSFLPHLQSQLQSTLYGPSSYSGCSWMAQLLPLQLSSRSDCLVPLTSLSASLWHLAVSASSFCPHSPYWNWARNDHLRKQFIEPDAILAGKATLESVSQLIPLEPKQRATRKLCLLELLPTRNNREAAPMILKQYICLTKTR